MTDDEIAELRAGRRRHEITYPIGFPQPGIEAIEVAPGERGRYASTAAVGVRPYRFVVPASIAAKFRITQIDVSGGGEFRRVLLGEPIDCQKWTEGSVARFDDYGLTFGDVLAEQLVTIEFENVGALPEVFRAVILGHVIGERTA